MHRCIFVLDLENILMYSTAILQVRNTVKALITFIYADVNVYRPM